MTEKNNIGKLIIRDNGVGFREKITNKVKTNSLGMKMIEQLCKQIDADYKYSSTNKGVLFSLQFDI